jgi:HK97 family phage major capsid protein
MSAALEQKKHTRSIYLSQLSQFVIQGKEDTEAYRTLNQSLSDLDQDIAMLSKIEAKMSEAGMEATRAMPAQVATAAATAAQDAVRSTISSLYSGIGLSADERRHRSNVALRSMLLNGRNPNLAEQRDLLTTNDVAGGALVPQAYDDVLLQNQKWFAPLLGFVKLCKDRTGNPVKAAWVDDVSNGLTLIQEGVTTLSEGPDPVFHSQIVTPDLFNAGYVRVARELISDSNFDFGQLINDLALTRYYRGLEKVLTLGTDSHGTTTPNNPGILSAATVGTTTSTIAAGVGWDDVVALFTSLDKAFRPTAVWQLSSGTEAYLLGLKDTTGRPFFVPNPTTGALDNILGRPVVINEQLATVDLTTPSTQPILFGALDKGYFAKMDESPIITVLRERFADLNEIAFQIGCRIGSVGMVSGTIKSLKIAAS